MRISTSMRWLVVAVSAAMLLAVAAACGAETVEVPGETVVVEKVVTETVEVPGETVVVEKEVVKTVEVPGETVTKEVVKEVMVPGETVVVEKEVVKTVEVPGQTVVKEVVKTVEVPGQTVVVEKEVVKTVEVPGETVVVTKEVAVPVEVVREVPSGKNYVTDPTTGKVVSAPQYGGTFTFPAVKSVQHTDTYFFHVPAFWVSGVVEKLGISDWGTPRDVFDFRTTYIPHAILKGHLAESWDVSEDGLTYTLNIRKGVNWHDKAPMNGREFTAYDAEFNYHRMLGNKLTGTQFSEAEPSPFGGAAALTSLPFESITATDKYTLVVKLTERNLDAVKLMVVSNIVFLYPPEVIKEHGDVKDWRNLVGTGPFELIDWVDGTSFTYTKNPNYWGFDEKYPENRLPYVDGWKYIIMPDVATRISAIRTGKIDAMAYFASHTVIGGPAALEHREALKRSNPELVIEPMSIRSENSSFGFNAQLPPFDDVRVRHALQMALDLDEINRTYWKGYADTVPQGYLGVAMLGYVTPFEQWPEEIKGYYTYDPEGAEALLDAAGFPRGADGMRFTAIIEMPSGWAAVWIGDLSRLAISYWQAIGIDVEIGVMEGASFYPTLAAGKGLGIFPRHSGYEWNVIGQIKHQETGNPANHGNVDDPTYNAMVKAAEAATTIEEQKRLVKEIDMYIIEKHWILWGSRAPMTNVVQPWVIGFNGEADLGDMDRNAITARLWLDLDLKAAMGY